MNQLQLVKQRNKNKLADQSTYAIFHWGTTSTKRCIKVCVKINVRVRINLHKPSLTAQREEKLRAADFYHAAGSFVSDFKPDSQCQCVKLSTITILRRRCFSAFTQCPHAPPKTSLFVFPDKAGCISGHNVRAQVSWCILNILKQLETKEIRKFTPREEKENVFNTVKSYFLRWLSFYCYLTCANVSRFFVPVINGKIC